MVKDNDKPIFDEADRILNDVTMQCNNCDDLTKKINKTEKDYNVKKQGTEFITDPIMKQRMNDQIDSEFNNKLDRLRKIKERNCTKHK